MLSYLDRCRKELDQIQYADDTLARLEKDLKKAQKEAARRGEVLSQARREAAGALQARVQEELRQLDMPKVQFQTEFTPKGGEAGMDETGLDEVQFLMSANLGEALSKARQQAARELQSRVQEELRQLDMPKVRFQVEFGPKPGEFAMDDTGMDEVQFLMSANVGEDLKPIQKIASGGELARIMLALKNVLAENDQVGTMVFDEVDTGVSGRAAQKVAEKLADVAHAKQVLCVTHLPQLAAMADVHFSVQKGEREGRTYTRLERLDRSQRREELARLIGGASITPSLLESAEELLRQAEQQKQV